MTQDQDDPKKLIRCACGLVLDFTGLVKCFRCGKILCSSCIRKFRKRPCCKTCQKEVQKEECLQEKVGSEEEKP